MATNAVPPKGWFQLGGMFLRRKWVMRHVGVSIIDCGLGGDVVELGGLKGGDRGGV